MQVRSRKSVVRSRFKSSTTANPEGVESSYPRVQLGARENELEVCKIKRSQSKLYVQS